MIVRINQLDPARAEEESGWAEQGLLGPIRYNWPADVHVYEVLILERDEQKQAVDEAFRRQQLRQLIPEAAVALREMGEELVVRLDGPLVDGELLAAMHRLTGPDRKGRFAVSPVRKLETEPVEEIASIRVQQPVAALSTLCADPALGLERSVRLRAFAVREELVNPLLDVDTTEDERWGEILDASGFLLSTTYGLRSLQVRTRRLSPSEIKSRLIRRLVQRGA